MGYVVLHLDKAPGNEARMTAHIERTQMPANADPSRTHLNRELIAFPEGVADRTEAINYRLEHAGLTRKIGTNQVRVIRVMLTGSHDDMKRIEAEGKLDQWCADNLAWLNKTFGADNVVSAVLHLDESTPHIHAAVVPIVTGERRKVREKREPDKPGKKKYRKKSPDAARLCADDVMTRVKLKSYQDTYAEAMAGYGLQRGIDGSVARHISTQEFYRNAIAGQKNLQDNIDELLRIEEQKRQAVERLKQQEQQARMNYEQAEATRERKSAELAATETELKTVKGELKTEKLKSAAAEVGSNIVESIGSLVGTSKVKRQQQEIENLAGENEALRGEIEGLNKTIRQERREHEQAEGKLQGEIDNIYGWFPDTPQLIRWGEYCRSLGFSDGQARDLVNMRPVHFSGKLYSSEHSRHFEIENAEARLTRDEKGPGGFQLFIDRIPILRWFRQKAKEFLEHIGIKIKDRQQGQGIRMK
ncbi:MobV family relaxase [Alistipes ihumii]|uniref:MobV family relaxase n=1 Tax=Alistipes ihumii TaxID=1470347 RepID=UPI003AB6F91F